MTSTNEKSTRTIFAFSFSRIITPFLFSLLLNTQTLCILVVCMYLQMTSIILSNVHHIMHTHKRAIYGLLSPLFVFLHFNFYCPFSSVELDSVIHGFTFHLLFFSFSAKMLCIFMQNHTHRKSEWKGKQMNTHTQ